MVAVATLNQANRHLDVRSRALALALQRWLDAFARHELQFALYDPRAYARLRVRKEKDPELDRLKAELNRLLMIYGLREVEDAQNRVGRELIQARGIRDATRDKEVRIKWFWEIQNSIVRRVEDITEATREAARESVKRTILESLKEPVQPSVGEIARRIRTQFQAPTGARGEAAEIERPLRVHAREEGREFVFSSERAAIIARTELAQAQNSGTFAGYEAAGVEEVEWHAYSDGRSGNRHHERMNGERVKLGEYFTTPLGNKLRFPADPFAPIGETINCRCSLSAAIDTKPKSVSVPDAIEPEQASVTASEGWEERATEVVGRSVSERAIAALGGLAGATVEVFPSTFSQALTIQSKNENASALRYLYRDLAGKLVLENANIEVAEDRRGKGIGASILEQQVRAARDLGVDRIETEANRGSSFGGYYAYARLGFDAELPPDIQAATGYRRLSELMATPQGAAWWKEHGRTFKGVFDLSPGSYSRRTLDRYLREKRRQN